MRLLCGAGGCAVGYSRAGFTEIVGVDNRPQPRSTALVINSGAPLRDALLLCGTMFRLRVKRHRLFESSIYLSSPGQRCWHPRRGVIGKAGIGGKKVGDWISVAGSTNRKVAAAAMGIDWMANRHELAQAIPPAYTLHVGRQLLSAIGGRS